MVGILTYEFKFNSHFLEFLLTLSHQHPLRYFTLVDLQDWFPDLTYQKPESHSSRPNWKLSLSRYNNREVILTLSRGDSLLIVAHEPSNNYVYKLGVKRKKVFPTDSLK